MCITTCRENQSIVTAEKPVSRGRAKPVFSDVNSRLTDFGSQALVQKFKAQIKLMT